jgi:hypothetical protein
MDGGPVHVIAKVDLRLPDPSPLDRLSLSAERICSLCERLEWPLRVFGVYVGASLLLFSTGSLIRSISVLRLRSRRKGKDAEDRSE